MSLAEQPVGAAETRDLRRALSVAARRSTASKLALMLKATAPDAPAARPSKARAKPRREVTTSAAKSSEKVVFISYARADRRHAIRLARYLQSRGIKVWWDFHLVAGDRFRQRILAELRAAAAVIVIWSPASVGRDFVLDEAHRAKTMQKLITMCVPTMNMEEIPLGFGQFHVISLGERKELVETLAAYDVRPAA